MARTPASSRVLTDHDEIRRWAEERGAKPARVKGTGGDGDVGIIRLDFPGYTGEDTLEPISWDDWFRKFDESNLALIVQDTTARGQKSNFNKLVSRETLEELSEGRRPARRRASANGRGQTRSQGRGRRSASSRSRSSQSSGGSRSSGSSRSKTSSRSGGSSGSKRGKKSSRSSRSAGTRSQGGNRGSRRNVVIEVECAPEQSRTSRSRTTARSSSGKKSSSRASSGRRKAA